MNKRIYGMTALAFGLSVGAVSLAATPWKLRVGSTSVSTSAKVIGGVTYVPISDVARAFGLRAKVSGTTITLVKPAVSKASPKASPKPARLVPTPTAAPIPTVAPSPIDLSKGVPGESLAAGKLGFRVVDVKRTQLFAEQHVSNFNRIASYDAEAGQDLIVVSCRLQNRGSEAANFAFPQGVFALNTAIFDDNGGSYRPIGIDVAAQQSGPLGRVVAPGAALAFNLIFRLPDDAQPKNLIYSAIVYGEMTNNKSTDFSVDLASSNPNRSP